MSTQTDLLYSLYLRQEVYIVSGKILKNIIKYNQSWFLNYIKYNYTLVTLLLTSKQFISQIYDCILKVKYKI